MNWMLSLLPLLGEPACQGGKGSIFGSFVGILVVGILTNGLDLLGVSSYYQQIIKGAIILLAVLADRKKRLTVAVVKER